MKTSIIIPLLLFLLFRFNSCLALELGFYDHKRASEVFTEEGKADRRIFCESLDNVDIGLGPLDGTGDDAAVWPIYYKLNDIAPFLQKGKHKELIVFRFGKGMNLLSDQQRKDAVAQVEAVAREAGYKRVLVLGSWATGVSVIEDKILSTLEDSYSDDFPDMSIRVERDYLIDIGINRSKGDSELERTHRRAFKMDELKHFLESQPHKDVLFVELPKWLPREKLPEKLQTFLRELGYAKVVFEQDKAFFDVEPVVIDERH